MFIAELNEASSFRCRISILLGAAGLSCISVVRLSTALFDAHTDLEVFGYADSSYPLLL